MLGRPLGPVYLEEFVNYISYLCIRHCIVLRIKDKKDLIFRVIYFFSPDPSGCNHHTRAETINPLVNC